MFELISFYLFTILIIASLLITIFTSNILYAMTSLASGMIFISGIFFTLDAEFLGVVQISAYTGAIMALYAFGMMFFDSSKNVKENIINEKIILSLSIGILLILIMLIIFNNINENNIFFINLINIVGFNSIVNNKTNNYIEVNGNIEQIGAILFTKYLIIFEIAAIMLLIAMIAGIALSKKNNKENI